MIVVRCFVDAKSIYYRISLGHSPRSLPTCKVVSSVRMTRRIPPSANGTLTFSVPVVPSRIIVAILARISSSNSSIRSRFFRMFSLRTSQGEMAVQAWSDIMSDRQRFTNSPPYPSPSPHARTPLSVWAKKNPAKGDPLPGWWRRPLQCNGGRSIPKRVMLFCRWGNFPASILAGSM